MYQQVFQRRRSVSQSPTTNHTSVSIDGNLVNDASLQCIATATDPDNDDLIYGYVEKSEYQSNPTFNTTLNNSIVFHGWPHGQHIL